MYVCIPGDGSQTEHINRRHLELLHGEDEIGDVAELENKNKASVL